MSQLNPPTSGSLTAAVVPRLRVDRTVPTHILAGRVLTDDGYVDSRDEVEFADAIVGPAGPQGPPGDPGVHVGPTPPSDTSLIWVDTS